MNEKSYLTPSLTPNGSSNIPINSNQGSSSSSAPPPYRFHPTNPSTPSHSRPSSRPSSPPHGGSLPSPGLSSSSSSNNHHHHHPLNSPYHQSTTTNPGTFSLNLGGGSYGGYYVIQIPLILQRILGLLLRRWKSLVFIGVCGTLMAWGIFGAVWTEWREMTYVR